MSIATKKNIVFFYYRQLFLAVWLMQLGETISYFSSKNCTEQPSKTDKVPPLSVKIILTCLEYGLRMQFSFCLGLALLDELYPYMKKVPLTLLWTEASIKVTMKPHMKKKEH